MNPFEQQFNQSQQYQNLASRLSREAFLNGRYDQRTAVVPQGRYQTICGTWFVDAKGNQIPSFVVKRA
jgi:hypothetical protein